MSRKLNDRVAEKLMDDWYIPYSTDMNAAMELLNTYEKYQITKGKYVYKVFIYAEDWITGSDESLPTAICLAALKAVGDGEWAKWWVEEYL